MAQTSAEKARARVAAKRDIQPNVPLLVELESPSFTWVLNFAIKWAFAMILVGVFVGAVVAFFWGLVLLLLGILARLGSLT